MKIAICDDDRQELSHILSLLDSYQAQQHVTFTICRFTIAVSWQTLFRNAIQSVIC